MKNVRKFIATGLILLIAGSWIINQVAQELYRRVAFHGQYLAFTSFDEIRTEIVENQIQSVVIQNDFYHHLLNREEVLCFISRLAEAKKTDVSHTWSCDEFTVLVKLQDGRDLSFMINLYAHDEGGLYFFVRKMITKDDRILIEFAHPLFVSRGAMKWFMELEGMPEYINDTINFMHMRGNDYETQKYWKRVKEGVTERGQPETTPKRGQPMNFRIEARR